MESRSIGSSPRRVPMVRIAGAHRAEAGIRLLAALVLLVLWGMAAALAPTTRQAAPTWSEAWRTETPGRVSTPPLVTAARVFVAAGSTLLALDAADGAVVWSAETGEMPALGPTLAGDAIFVANRDGTLSRFATADGELLWQATGLDFAGGPPVVADGSVYLNGRVGQRGWLVAYDVESGGGPMSAAADR